MKGIEAKIAVFTAITKDGQVLLSKRKNTGWLDGYYDIPSGHLEPGETILDGAIRELEEETGLAASKGGMELFHICQNDMTPSNPYLFLMFRANRWSGEPSIKEPQLSEDQRFFKIDGMPENTLPYVVEAIGKIGTNGISFSYFGPEDLEKLIKD